MSERLRRWAERVGPWLLLGALVAALAAPVLDPAVQLYDRDTGRCEYPLKHELARRLARGELPLWVPWTEAGTSLLGQITPALFHPITALYLALPFDLAFKLNHLLALPLAALGLWLLARRLSASPWAATAGAAAYAGSGWVVSMTGSNLHYAIGAAFIPLALAGLGALLERPGPLRLLWASGALACCMLGGEPQSMLIGGVLGAAFAPALAPGRSLARTAGAVAAWGACAALLAAPAVLPALSQVARSSRPGGTRAAERGVFAVPPVRLAGLALPWAFDETMEEVRPADGRAPYFEYLADLPGTSTPFSTSIALGVPALLLAACAAGRRRGAVLLGGALVLALAATGPALPVDALLRAVVPGLGYFRYAEKMLGPATLLFALAAALGADRALSRARPLALGAAAAGLFLVAARGALAAVRPAAQAWLQARGHTHAAIAAALEVDALGAALSVEGGLALALAAIAFAASRGAAVAAPLTAALCAGAAWSSSANLLFTAPVQLLHGPFLAAEALRTRAGPSPGRWRIDSDPDRTLAPEELDWRAGMAHWMAQSLATQYNGLADVESAAVYSSVGDRDYLDAWHAAPGAMSALFGVRFQIRSVFAGTEAQARAQGFSPLPLGLYARELPEEPRAFLVRCVVPAPPASIAPLLAAPGFDPHRTALVRGDAAARPPCTAAPERVRLDRPSPEQLEIDADSEAGGLVVVAEHYDPGWSATVDGAPAEVVQVDLAAIGVRVPALHHRVTLRYVPRGLWAGLGAAALALAGLAGWGALRRRRAGSQPPARDASPRPFTPAPGL